MSDLISRQDAINALIPIVKSASLRNRNVYSTARKCLGAIEDLPSAEPEIIRCKDCKHYNKFIATLFKTGQAVWDEYCGKFRGSVTADDFCSRAERREKE